MPKEQTPLPYPTDFIEITSANGNSSNLQVVTLGKDGQVYLAAWQCAVTGVWKIQSTNILSFVQPHYFQLVLAPGADGQLQLLGLHDNSDPAKYQGIYLLAWQDKGGGWHPPGNHWDGAVRPKWQFTAFDVSIGADGALQVIGLGLNQEAYIAAYQTSNGHWHQPGDNVDRLRPDWKITSLVLGTNDAQQFYVFGLG